MRLLMRHFAAPPLLLLAAACAPSPPPSPPDPLIAEQVTVRALAGNPDLPDVRSVRRALMEPTLAGCDELACWYHAWRLYDVRALTCARVPDRSERGEEHAECSYERRPTVRPGDPEREWRPARTSFVRQSDGWHTLTDSPREE